MSSSIGLLGSRWIQTLPYLGHGFFPAGSPTHNSCFFPDGSGGLLVLGLKTLGHAHSTCQPACKVRAGDEDAGGGGGGGGGCYCN